MRNLFAVASVLLLLASACAAPDEAPAPAVDLASERASLMQADQAWFEEYSTSDRRADAFVNRVTDSAYFLPPDAPMVQGREAIHSAVATLEAMPGFSITSAC